MKKTLFFTAMLLMSNIVNAQAENQINIFQPGGVWYLQDRDWKYQEQRLAVKGDTTLCGHECHQVWRSTNGGTETLIANIFTEGDKVYFVKSDKVHLMYDFGLQPGDTTHVDLLNDELFEDNAERYVKCLDRYTVTNNGHSFEVMKMGEYYYNPEEYYSDDNSFSELTWIVGVGTFSGPFRNFSFDVVDIRFPKLLEAKLGDEVLYDAYAGKYDKYSQELVTPPASLATYEVDCLAAYTWKNETDGLQWSAQMGFDGDDVYVQGLCTDLPEAWVKGKLTGDEVVFKSQQFIGYLDLFADDDHLTGPFYFASGNLKPELVMTWDAETRTLQCPDNSYLARFLDDNYYLLDLYYNVTITPKDATCISALTQNEASEIATYNIYGTRVGGSSNVLTIRNGRIELHR